VDALTQSVDVFPTLLELFAVPPAGPTHGRSLLPLARGEVTTIRPYACSALAIGPAVEWSLRTSDWAFLLPVQPHLDDPPRPPQLYAKPDDRWEVNNVRQHYLDWCDHLETTVRAFAAAPGEPPALKNRDELEPGAG
jgi:arylsulfatase A-like enzyme